MTVEIDEGKKKEVQEKLAKYEQLFGADEDAYVQPTTTRKELWSYYLYYNVRLNPAYNSVQQQPSILTVVLGRQRSWSRFLLASSVSVCPNECGLGSSLHPN